MAQAELQYNLRVTQEMTRQLLGVLDADGVAHRTHGRLNRRVYRCSGPNHVWHIDGMDKLKQFGLAIHGPIDGFSRNVLWMEVGHSNNDPALIAGFYMKLVKRLHGVPSILRSDRGTENSVVRILQIALRMEHEDGLSGQQSFQYGRSTANQRIESFWSQLRRMVVQFWITFFRDMRDLGQLDNSNPMHIDCLRFCFGQLVQSALDQAVHLWNNHCIRRQRFAECPSGIPNMIYHTPNLYGTTNRLKPLIVTEDELNIAQAQHCKSYPPFRCSPEFVNFIRQIIDGEMENYEMPTSADEALSLYLNILEIIE